MVRRLFAGAAAAMAVLAASPAAAQEDLEALRAEVRAVFEQYCVRCHQEDPAHSERLIEEFGNILDFEAMEASEYVVPGDPDASTMYTQVRDDEMPPLAYIGVNEPVHEEGKEAIRAWIEALGAE